MAMTHKQRNFLLGCVAVFVVYFVGGAILETMHRAAYLHHLQAIRAAQMQKAREQADAKAKAKAEAKAAAPAPDKAAIPAPTAKADSSPLTTVSNLSGTWNGRGALTGRGICSLRLELRETQAGTGHYTGYSTLSCLNIPALMSRAHHASGIQNHMNPAANILTGEPENGSIRFKVDKSISADANGCAATSFTATPFGSNKIAVQWQEGNCQGGEILLGRSGK
jgi:hypothetical protein